MGREDRKAYEPFAAACAHRELPVCGAACPLNLDAREVVRHIQTSNFTAAYKTYRNKAVFPEIVADLCDEPCKTACVRKDLDESVSLRLLEKACVEHARDKSIPNFNLPPKTQTVAVIGAGLSGLTCAVKLASKSYPVTVYERSGRLGGRLWDLLDPEVFLPALRLQLDAVDCVARLGSEVVSLDDLECSAVVVATGEGGEPSASWRKWTGDRSGRPGRGRSSSVTSSAPRRWRTYLRAGSPPPLSRSTSRSGRWTGCPRPSGERAARSRWICRKSGLGRPWPPQTVTQTTKRRRRLRLQGACCATVRPAAMGASCPARFAKCAGIEGILLGGVYGLFASGLALVFGTMRLRNRLMEI